MTTFLDLHVLQTVPPSNLNRDDMGSPKSAVFGGVRRARVSSQAWKRATRTWFAAGLDRADLGYRTTRIVEMVEARMAALDPDTDTDVRRARAEEVVKAVGLKPKPPRVSKKDSGATSGASRTEYLVFISDQQVSALAALALQAPESPVDKKLAMAAADTAHGIDVALFGRMVADDASLNVDAAVQVAHAISTHAVDTEFDYYTAVDDKNPEEDTGAGMIGTIEFNSATLYRYAALNLDRLEENLGDREATQRAVRAFVEGFVRSMPTGKQNSFANGTLPDAVVAVVRGDQPVSMVTAFEEPVRPAADRGWVAESARRLRDQVLAVDSMYGAGRRSTWVSATPVADVLGELGEQVPVPDLVDAVTGVVLSRA